MKNGKFVTINGKRYDAVTGVVIGKASPLQKATDPKSATNATAVHSLVQKSQTLYRRATQKPISRNISLVRKNGSSMDIARSKKISHFAPNTVTGPVKTASAKPQIDIKPVKHPLMVKVDNIRAARAASNTPTVAKSAKTIKEEAIAEAFKKLAEKQKDKKVNLKKRFKFINFFFIGIVLLVIIGYFAYLNLPNLSVKIASAQAGIEATFPEYHPDGYSFSGSPTYSEGEVVINFKANTGNKKFAIKQSKSSWDSSALKNQIEKDSKGDFNTTNERGLTIYTYTNNAAWVNGGILYTITGDAPLTGDQIRRIATSL